MRLPWWSMHGAATGACNEPPWRRMHEAAMEEDEVKLPWGSTMVGMHGAAMEEHALRCHGAAMVEHARGCHGGACMKLLWESTVEEHEVKLPWGSTMVGMHGAAMEEHALRCHGAACNEPPWRSMHEAAIVEHEVKLP